MRLPNGSGVSREAPAPFCEGLTGKFRGSTHHLCEVVLLLLQIDGLPVVNYVLFVAKNIRH